jgi:multisubunit Na+/H+ antiporter MnhB subunit
MSSRILWRRAAFVLAALFVVAVGVCAVATVMAGPLTSVFFWPFPQEAGVDIVQTKEQYEAGIAAQRIGTTAAVTAVLLAVGAVVALTLSRRRPRGR